MSRQRSTPRSERVDFHIGQRLRQRRLALNMDGPTLDRTLEASPGTVDRFERGKRAVGASHLFRLSQALDVPVSYFFEGLPQTAAKHGGAAPDPQLDGEIARFLRVYASVSDVELRKRLFNLVKSVADSQLEGG